jgi:hypothetical protein
MQQDTSLKQEQRTAPAIEVPLEPDVVKSQKSWNELEK